MLSKFSIFVETSIPYAKIILSQKLLFQNSVLNKLQVQAFHCIVCAPGYRNIDYCVVKTTILQL